MGKRFTERMEWLRSAWRSAWASEKEGRHERLRRGLNAWIGLIVSISCGPTIAAAAPSLLPAESNYRVKWSQPDTTPPVANWEIEVTPVRNANARFVVGAQVTPQLSCWALNVPMASRPLSGFDPFPAHRPQPGAPTRPCPSPASRYTWFT